MIFGLTLSLKNRTLMRRTCREAAEHRVEKHKGWNQSHRSIIIPVFTGQLLWIIWERMRMVVSDLLHLCRTLGGIWPDWIRRSWRRWNRSDFWLWASCRSRMEPSGRLFNPAFARLWRIMAGGKALDTRVMKLPRRYFIPLRRRIN